MAPAGRLAFVSGQGAWRVSGEPVPPDLADQTDIVVQNAKAALQEIGASAGDLVAARVYITELAPERLEVVLPRLVVFFGGAAPSLTGIGVSALAAPDLQIELEMLVSLPA